MPNDSRTVSRKTADLEGQLAALLQRVRRPGRYVGGEFNIRRKTGSRPLFVLSYPDAYEIGISNPALQILYTHLNDVTDVAAERAYCPWPDMADLMRREGLTLWTLESGRPVNEAAVWGFTLPHELAFTNVLEMLDLAGVPLLSAERREEDPVVLGGGPAAANPLPLAAFFDAFFVGEAEAHLDALAAAAAGADRRDRLRLLSEVPGVWMPRAPVSGASPVRRQVFGGFSVSPPVLRPLVPVLEAVHDRAVIEVMRGCTAGCRFCQAGSWYRPVRERPVDMIVDAADALLRETGCDEVSLISLSSCDYSGVAEAVPRIRALRPGLRVSLPSLRVDSAAVTLAALGAGQRGSVTLAPEAATPELRAAINKRIDDEQLTEATEAVFRNGFTGLKLYFMLGLPGETDEDVARIAAVAERVAGQARALAGGRARLAVSVSTFVPKAATPFAAEPFVGSAAVTRRQAALRERWPRGVRLATHEVTTSLLEAVLARGGEAAGDLVLGAWRHGARFDGWTELFDLRPWQAAARELGVDLEAAAQAPPAASPVDALVSRVFLAEELRHARRGEVTGDCRVDGCRTCGVCAGSIEMDLLPIADARTAHRGQAAGVTRGADG
jgi:radical SAM family uncharacterized protein